MEDKNQHKEEEEEVSSGSFVCCDRLHALSSKYPWFIAQSLKDEQTDTGDHYLCTIDQDPLYHYHCQIPELIGKHIRGYFHGWMVLTNHPHNNMWSLWNPSSTSNIISLPPLFLKDGDYELIKECCLSGPPDDHTSVLLLTIDKKPSFVFCQLAGKRTKKLRKKPRWREMSYSRQIKKVTWNGVLLHSLTCCNGKVYALNTDASITRYVVHVEIVVKDKEVVIELGLFGATPFLPSGRSEWIYFLKGCSTDLFYIAVGFMKENRKTPDDVNLFKLDTNCIKWEEIVDLKNWDISGLVWSAIDFQNFDYLDVTREMWEEVKDLKDAVFFVDLARVNSIFYNHTIASEFGGRIYIRDKIDNVIYSYHVSLNTIVPSRMPFPMLPTSHVSILECSLGENHGEATFLDDSKQEANEMAVESSTADEKVEVGESFLLDIPYDLMEKIMTFCHGVEYMNFRATCKRCHLAAPLIQWRNETSLTRLQNYSLVSPLLMVVEKNQGIITFTDPLLGDNYFMRRPHISIQDDTIYCSRFGWLLIKIDRLVFFNPFTNDIHYLPSPSDCLENLCFSAPPTSPDCIVVGFGSTGVRVHFVAREPTWSVHELPVDTYKKALSFPTFFGGDLFALCNVDTQQLIVFKSLGSQDYSFELFEAVASRSYCERFLVTCDQHLLLVVVGVIGEPIEVFKLNDGSKREWEKISCLGKHMIYICDATCLCIEAKIPEMENKIYLPQICSTNKKIVFYSLETCTFHTFDGKRVQEELKDIFTTSAHLSAKAWIEPSWCRWVKSSVV